jgi:hypothetical protein
VFLFELFPAVLMIVCLVTGLALFVANRRARQQIGSPG